MFVHDLVGYMPIAAALGGFVATGSVLLALLLALLVPAAVAGVNALAHQVRGAIA